MHGPELVGWLLVALCASAGAYCLLRMRDGTPEQRRTDAGEAFMGFGMAVMALPASVVEPLPPPVFAVVFSAAAVRELVLVRHAPTHHLHHAVGALAMVHMALVMAAPGGPGGHHAVPAGASALTGALLVYFVGYVLWTGTRLAPVGAGCPAGASGGGGTVRGLLRAPEVAVACRLSMGLGMLAMLLAM
ncbi:DUF5134 domain-containing protein [Streptomyces megasporus]|uniref:DUF5134 domain-containing protein n=1 Tax=Streptomyces megasporus TaxID=44060 RepID=UPI0004E1A608|nr:DUF5134 domain-containing protein [Streptomyces megasporus]